MTSSGKSNVDNDDLICPITYQLFCNPVIAGDGHTYECAAIVRWILEHGTSPLTRQSLNLNELQPDDYLRNLAAQRRSSSISSNYNIDLDQSVLDQQNSTMSHNFNTYIDQLVVIHQPTMINNDAAPISNTNNINVFCNDYADRIIGRILLVIMTILMITFVLYQLYFGPTNRDYSKQSISSTHTNTNTKWKQNGVTIAGGYEEGDQLNQLNSPQGIYVDDDDQCIYIADLGNDRIIKWKFGANFGEVVAGGNRWGDRIDQLMWPIDVIVDKKNDSLIICDYGNRRVVRWPRRNGKNGQTIISEIRCNGLTMDNNENLYVSDNEKNEVRRYKIGDKNGTIVAGGNGEGNHFNQLRHPSFIFVDEDYSIYISDNENHRVMKWMKGAKEGIVVAGGQDEGDSLTQLSYPQGVIVDGMGNVYVADANNNRVMCWRPGSKEGNIVVGENGRGQQPNQFYYLRSLSFNRQGNLYVTDCWNHRVQKFDIVSS